MILSLLRKRLSRASKVRVLNCIYSPLILRDQILCWWWGIHRPKGMRLVGVPLVQQWRRNAITIGRNFKAVSATRYNSIGLIQPVVIKALWLEGSISIGDNVGISGATISSRKGITIGNHVVIGSGVLIVDNDSHPLHPDDRGDPSCTECAPVIIEDDVFIGARSIILKGVTVGRGSVIGAGSVVSKDVPQFTIVAGNPAQVIRKL